MFSNHPFAIICADALMLDPRFTGPTSRIWDWSNQWNPPDLSEFYVKPPPITAEKFSLKDFVKLS